jgi:hypothetical protein
MTVDPELSGRVAIGPDAARGIGAALARKPAASRAWVPLAGLEPDGLSATAERCARLSRADIASLAAIVPVPRLVACCASKSGVEAFARAPFGPGVLAGSVAAAARAGQGSAAE